MKKQERIDPIYLCPQLTLKKKQLRYKVRLQFHDKAFVFHRIADIHFALGKEIANRMGIKIDNRL